MPRKKAYPQRRVLPEDMVDQKESVVVQKKNRRRKARSTRIEVALCDTLSLSVYQQSSHSGHVCQWNGIAPTAQWVFLGKLALHEGAHHDV